MINITIRLKSWISRNTYSEPNLRRLLEDTIEEFAKRDRELYRNGERIAELHAGGCRFNCRNQREAFEAGWSARHDYIYNPCNGSMSERYLEWKKKK